MGEGEQKKKGIDRRNLLMGAAALGATAAGCSPDEAFEQTRERWQQPEIGEATVLSVGEPYSMPNSEGVMEEVVDVVILFEGRQQVAPVRPNQAHLYTEGLDVKVRYRLGTRDGVSLIDIQAIEPLDQQA